MAELQSRTEFLEHYTYSKVSWSLRHFSDARAPGNLTPRYVVTICPRMFLGLTRRSLVGRRGESPKSPSQLEQSEDLTLAEWRYVYQSALMNERLQVRAWKETWKIKREYQKAAYDRFWGIANDGRQPWVGILPVAKRLEATAVR